MSRCPHGFAEPNDICVDCIRSDRDAVIRATSIYNWPSHLPLPNEEDIRALALQIQSGDWDVSDAYTLASSVLAFLADAALDAPTKEAT